MKTENYSVQYLFLSLSWGLGFNRQLVAVSEPQDNCPLSPEKYQHLPMVSHPLGFAVKSIPDLCWNSEITFVIGIYIRGSEMQLSALSQLIKVTTHP